MAGRVLKVLEDQGLVRASGKTIVVFNARRELPRARATEQLRRA
jgi:CRP/FNR family cyclic AMP-dependent transcriptional regulator